MYRITVPIMSANVEICGGKEKILSELKRVGAQRVLLALNVLCVDPAEKARELSCLKENVEFFKANGLEVGSWMWTFWTRGANEFVKMESADGKRAKDFACPLDEEFRAFVCNYVQDIAKCGVDIIQFDDDFRYGYLTGSSHITCLCPLHMKKIHQLLGECPDPMELEEKALTGGKNKYRDAWMKVNGDALKSFAYRIRQALDEVNPNIRIGFCSCMPVWDVDGVDTVTLAKILAGNTKPLIRLIGAPYWAVEKHWQRSRVQNVIDMERMERSWCSGEIEICSEGDVYPRPRTNCPASYLELFDMAMRIDGRLDGIMKYVLDYSSAVGYETGYADMHLRNTPIYEGIEQYFSGKEAVGVRIYETMNKLQNMEILPHIKEGGLVYDTFFSPASHLLGDNSIPSTFEGEGVCGIAFGENIKYVPEEAFKRGMIIDAGAARILTAKGIDTGFAFLGEEVHSSREIEEETGMHVSYTGAFISYRATLKEGAVLLSSLMLNDSMISEEPVKNPFVFRYENEQGYRFLIFNLEAYFCGDMILRGYLRTKQIADSVAWMSGRKLPAYAYGNPDLYILCKEKDTKKAVGLFNIFADPIEQPVVELDGEYKKIRCINCTGEIRGDKVYLSKIQPFSFAGFEVEK